MPHSTLIDEEKKLAAAEAVKMVNDGDLVGLGTGSTAEYFIHELAELVKKGLRITCVASSLRTEELARSMGLTILDDPGLSPDIDVDGADEIDISGNMIKGGGGALLREKIVAHNSKKVVIIGDHTKLKESLGEFPLPVEVSPFMLKNTLSNLRKLCHDSDIRGNGTYRTDNGNAVIDCHFGLIDNPEKLLYELLSIPGVQEVGIFVNLCSTLLLGKGTNVEVIKFKE